jgi:aldose sugar dehydrogenase
LNDKVVLLDGVKGASNHDGGRIEFGPDGKLYITTGDAQEPNLAQDTNSLNGKILRINPDGTIPTDNPFNNAVYSYGHRNVQGLAWDDSGNLWATEHGPSGVQTGNDELNYIQKGKNYGWPEIKGQQSKSGMETPVIESGRNDTWAPAGAEYVNGSIFFAGLRGSALYEAKLSGTSVTDTKIHFRGEYGRLRAARLGPDGYLYLTTSNTDGRGSPKTGDDKLIRIHPRVFD